MDSPRVIVVTFNAERGDYLVFGPYLSYEHAERERGPLQSRYPGASVTELVLNAPIANSPRIVPWPGRTKT